MTDYTMALNQQRLVFEVWSEEQAIMAARAAKEFAGETVIRWVSLPQQTNWSAHGNDGTTVLKYSVP